MASTILTPYRRAVAITPHDSTNMATCDAIYVGGAGNMVVVFDDDTTATFTAVPVGTTLRVRAKRVNSTSTTATNLLALYN
jgi:hypothetical protein